ncbi:substrate-binding domain-containing protein [Alkalicella caledoniensis]|uniref:Substrate-binding domain-containing protein n=1 Tax=Alkalicella caledoniensis TaxID=2731377 RepID=A0A7G9WAQ2_ALKCA|nr:substrate-binding domain-containing protein [Alkalicella caledoniensis]QNO15764.1 substrate-binding domain-containing protein [Alkalicella caledoniensis]
MSRFVKFFSIMLLVVFFLVGCGTGSSEESSIILATTTSTENSGLLDFLLPIFQEDTGIEVKVIAVGTGQAIKLGEDGEADVLLAHAKASEEAFVAAGHGVERFDVMYNDFVLIGPDSDPLNVKGLAGNDIVKALEIIKNSGEGAFISRGDESGTHKKELELWAELGLEPEGEWYKSVGAGMGETILMAEELQGYTLTDRATYLSMVGNLDSVIITEGDTKMFNQYGIIAVNPDKNDKINNEGAIKFIEWMLSEKGQELIKEFGVEEFGDSLFIPNAK